MKQMKANFSLKSDEIHLWSAWLPDFSAYEEDFARLLNQDEMLRANRFRFPIHKQRFILARSILRQLLSCYTHIAPEKIEFIYGPRGKPYLRDNPLGLQFNVSHSHDIVMYAVTVNDEIGVDVEQVKEYQEGVAERFFNPQEYSELKALPNVEQQNAFFRLWAAKEAIIKAVGEGLFIELSDFTVSAMLPTQTVLLTQKNQTKTLYLENISVHEGYQSALAVSADVIKQVSHYQWGCSNIR